MYHRRYLSLLVVFVLCITAIAQTADIEEEKQVNRNEVVAFVNVNVVPMDRERILEKQTVIVRDGRIAAVGPVSETAVPDKALKIDGRGKYLMPGLADMHVHLLPGKGAKSDLAGQQLKLLIANGVTTVRGMFGAPSHLLLREKVAKGKIIGPTIYAAGPPLLGNVAPTPEIGEQLVIEQKKAGYDLIKVHEGLSPETYNAIITTARRVGIPVAGHVTASVGLKRALEASQSSIEHLDGYINSIIADNAPVKPSPSQIVLGPILNNLDEAKIPVIAQETKKAGVWNSPTLALFKIIVSFDKPEDLLKWPEVQYVPEFIREDFVKQKQSTLNIPASASERKSFEAIRNKLVKGLHAAGAKLLTGSDSPQFFLVPGFALHRELQSFVDAGLTPYEAIEASTRNPAEYLKAGNEFGTVEVGKRADLILVEANPLQDITNLSKRAGVMVRGQWLPQSELQKILDDIAALNRK